MFTMTMCRQYLSELTTTGLSFVTCQEKCRYTVANKKIKNEIETVSVMKVSAIGEDTVVHFCLSKPIGSVSSITSLTMSTVRTLLRTLVLSIDLTGLEIQKIYMEFGYKVSSAISFLPTETNGSDRVGIENLFCYRKFGLLMRYVLKKRTDCQLTLKFPIQ